MKNTDLLLDVPTQTLREAFLENSETIRYHYVRLFKMILAEIKRGMRKPKEGYRYIAPLSFHQEVFLAEHKSGVYSLSTSPDPS
jgi:hypothetical protein